MAKAIQAARRLLLSQENRRRLRRALAQRRNKHATPVFFIFTPGIVHFAPYCISSGVDGFDPILVLNSVSKSDETWMRSLHPECPMVSLKVSLSGNERSLLPHGEVLNDLFAINDSPFCIQDPDCFVTDPDFWKWVRIDEAEEFACGPFTKRPTDHDHVLPDTFFLLLNPLLFKEISSLYRVSAAPTSHLTPSAQEAIVEIGYQHGQFPEQFKGYFDTLQAFWLLAMARGHQFRHLPGAQRSVFHIGGTSYLHKSDYDLAHWDFWPLSVIYFNLRLLEWPLGERFHGRFEHILAQYGSSAKLLETYPKFKQGWRFTELQHLLDRITS